MLGRVNRLLQAPQEAEVHRVFLGLTRRLAEDPLKLESALWQLEREPQAAGKLGEAVELVRVRVGVNSSQEAGVILGQVRRDRFVGRQHELLDDLVALVVHRQMSTAYLPLLAQLDCDLGKVQLQGARANRRWRRIMASSSMAATIRATSGATPESAFSGWFITSMACS